MPYVKKEQEREELHRAFWAIADELPGSVDGRDCKNYVLGTMFYRYISENLTTYINDGEQDSNAKNIITTIQKLSTFVNRNKTHSVIREWMMNGH